jgi:hypothetical protein
MLMRRLVVALSLGTMLALPLVSGCGDAPVERDTAPTGVDVIEGEGVTIWVTPPPKSATLAQTIRLEMSAQFDESIRVAPADTLDGLRGLGLIERRDFPATLGATRTLRQRWMFEFEPLELGDVVVPPIRFACRDRETGELGFVETAPYQIQVVSLLGENDATEVSEFRPVAPPPPPEQTFAQAVRVAISGVLLGLMMLGGIVWLFVRWLRRRQKPSGIPQARRRIESIRKRASTASGQELRSLLSEASLCVRGCMSERAELAAASMTPDEIAAACPEFENLDGSIDLLRSIDRAVFGVGDPSNHEASELLAWSARVIDDMGTFVPTRFLDEGGTGV